MSFSITTPTRSPVSKAGYKEFHEFFFDCNTCSGWFRAFGPEQSIKPTFFQCSNKCENTTIVSTKAGRCRGCFTTIDIVSLSVTFCFFYFVNNFSLYILGQNDNKSKFAGWLGAFKMHAALPILTEFNLMSQM